MLINNPKQYAKFLAIIIPLAILSENIIIYNLVVAMTMPSYLLAISLLVVAIGLPACLIWFAIHFHYEMKNMHKCDFYIKALSTYFNVKISQVKVWSVDHLDGFNINYNNGSTVFMPLSYVNNLKLTPAKAKGVLQE